ncbi:MAG: hypothetical protein II133_00325 [Lachnospiraceae bacterium]|nr:hypothetical protein [Lachnospiraceae bacterium]
MEACFKEKISDDETLYRAVLADRPDSYVGGKISPAVFIDPAGASFDRDGERDEEKIYKTFQYRFRNKDLSCLVALTAKQCRDDGTYPVPKPTKNEYHAEVHDSEEVVEISLMKAILLARDARVVIYE